MDYDNLSEDIKNKMYDKYLKDTCDEVYQEQFRFYIGRDFWLTHNMEKLEYYYREVNKLSRKEKITKLKNHLYEKVK